MLIVVMTFLFSVAIIGALVFFALRRVAMHLKDNPAGIEAVSTHVLLPLLGRKNATKSDGRTSSDDLQQQSAESFIDPKTIGSGFSDRSADCPDANKRRRG